MRVTKWMLSALALLVAMQSAQADFVSFDIGANGVTNGSTGNRWLVAGAWVSSHATYSVNPSLPTLVNTLNEGDSWTFAYGTIGISNNFVVPTNPATALITAVLTLDLPPLAGDVNNPGTIVTAVAGTLKNSNPSGSITVEFNPVLVSFGYNNTGQFTVDMSGFTLSGNTPFSRTVNATITLNQAPDSPPTSDPPTQEVISTPEPSSIALLLIGGLSTCGCKWWRRRKAKRIET